jgi:hypothetical protein
MRLRHIITIHALTATLLGLLLLLAPGPTLALFGMPVTFPSASPDQVEAWERFLAEMQPLAFARFFGVSLLTLAVALWQARPVSDQAQPGRGGMARAFFMVTTFALFLLLLQQLTIWNSGMGWVMVASHLLLVIGYGSTLVVRAVRRSRGAPRLDEAQGGD